MGTINKQFTKKDIIKSIKCCNQRSQCDICPLHEIYEPPRCLTVKTNLALKFLEESPVEPNNPLNLNDLIKLMKEEKPVFIVGYGWFFIERIISDKQATKIYTHNNSNFVYTENSERFYRNEVIG